MRFRIQGNGLADSASRIAQTLTMLPMMREQWAQDAQQSQMRNELLGAQTQAAQAQAGLNNQKAAAEKAALDALGFDNRFTNAANAYGVSPADVPDFLNFAKTKQMPGQFVTPADGVGPTLPAPKFYGDDTLSQVLRMAGMTGNAAALGDKNSSNVIQGLQGMQDMELVNKALGFADAGNNMGMSAINTIRGKKEFTPFKAVGNTGTALNEITGAAVTSDPGLRVLFGNESTSKTNENLAQALAARAAAGASSANAGLTTDKRNFLAKNGALPGTGAEGSEGALSSTILRTLDVPKLDAKGRPVRNPMTGAEEKSIDQEALKAFYSWTASNGVKPTALQFSKWEALGRPSANAATSAPTAAPKSQAQDALTKARDAIAKGAPRDKVIERLRQAGIDPKGL